MSVSARSAATGAPPCRTRIGAAAPEEVLGIHLVPPLVPPDPALRRSDPARAVAIDDLSDSAERDPATRGSTPTGRRRSAMPLSTPPPGCAPGSWRRSGPGPTATATWQSVTRDADAGRRHPLLADRRRRLVSPPVLGEHPRGVTSGSRARRPTASTCRPAARCSRRRSPARLGAGPSAASANIGHWGEPNRGGHFAAIEQLNRRWMSCARSSRASPRSPRSCRRRC